MRTHAISDSQLRQICKLVPPSDALAMRLMRQTGLRVSDVVSLPKSALARSMTITERKTGKTRTVHISPTLHRDLQRYAASHSDTRLIPRDRSSIYRSVHTAAAALGWENISAHSARKAYARAYAARHGARATQIELQHDRLETTLLYLTDID